MNLRNEQMKEDKAVDKMRNDYIETIEFVSEERDWKSLVITIAKHHPEIIAKYKNGVPKLAEKRNDVGMTQNELDEIWQLNVSGKKIQAIKQVRQYTGMGLKEAKDYVEHMDCPYPF